MQMSPGPSAPGPCQDSNQERDTQLSKEALYLNGISQGICYIYITLKRGYPSDTSTSLKPFSLGQSSANIFSWFSEIFLTYQPHIPRFCLDVSLQCTYFVTNLQLRPALQEASHSAQVLHTADAKPVAFVKRHFNLTEPMHCRYA